jgi:hypothetical protein
MSYQSNNQSSLDKLMQMATLEQLNNMIHQMNKNMNANTSSNTNETKDILSLPIVQKVVMAYEDELKIKQSNNCCSCDYQKQVIDYTPLFDTMLSKMSEQYYYYNSNLLRVETKVDELFAFLERQERSEKQERQDDIPKVDKSQLKLTDFPSFFRKYDIIDLTIANEVVTSEVVTSEVVTSEVVTSEVVTSEVVTSETIETFIPIKEENITLKIEEKDMSDAEDSDDVTEDEAVDDAEAVDVDDAEAVEDPPVTRLTIEEDEDLNDDEVSDEEAVENKEAIEDVEVNEAVSLEDEAVSVEDEDVSEEESEEEVRTDDEEEEKDEVKEQEEELDEDEDEEVFEIEIDDVTYFATDEENGILYEVDNGEVGRKVGIIKDGEPIFS